MVYDLEKGQQRRQEVADQKHRNELVELSKESCLDTGGIENKTEHHCQNAKNDRVIFDRCGGFLLLDDLFQFVHQVFVFRKRLS